MKYKKLIILIMIMSIFIVGVGCSRQEEIEEEPYIKYIITTYSGSKVIDTLEVYSNMGWNFNKSSVTIWDSPDERILLFYSTLEYKLEKFTDGHKAITR